MTPHRAVPRATALGALLLSLVLPLGCGGGPTTPGKTRVAFVTNNPANFWTIVEAGCQKAAREFDVEVIYRRPDQGDPAAQKRVIDSVLSQGPQGLSVSVIDPVGQRDFLNEVAAKVPLIAVDNDAPDTNRVCYIGTNNYLAGRDVGKLVKEAMPGGGTVVVFVGQLEPLNARQRRQGVLDELADAPPLKDINTFEVGKDGVSYGPYRLYRTYTDQPREAEKCRENATDALTQLAGEKKLCLVGLWAYNPPAMLSALKDFQKGARLGDVKIVGFDEDFATLDGIAAGHIAGTVVQDPVGFGYESVKLMTALAKGDRSGIPADKVMYIPHRVITKDGGPGRLPVAPFRKELEDILKK